MRITSEEMELRRDRMIRVAYNLFNECGIEGVSLEKIAKTAGVSSKTFYRYFGNKTQLIEQTQRIVWKEIVNCISSGIQLPLSKAANGLEEVRIILKGFEILYRDHWDYILFAYEFKSYFIRKRIRLPGDHYENMLSDVRAIFFHALERGLQDGSISINRPVSEVFLLKWGILRQYVEQMVIHSQLYEGENPWELMFPGLVDKIMESLKFDGGGLLL